MRHIYGVYVNFLDSDDDTSRVREAYGDRIYRRLAEVKARYDPDNVFHNSKNIVPAESGRGVAAPSCVETADAQEATRIG